MAKIIEARAVISGEEKLSPVLDKLSKKFDQIAKTAKTAEGVDKMAASLARVKQQLAAIEKFNASKLSFANAANQYKAAQEALARHMALQKSGVYDTKAAAAEQERLQREVTRTARAYEHQRSAALAARRALSSSGVAANNVVNEQNRITAAVERANTALSRQRRESHLLSRHGAVGTAATIAAGYVSAHSVAHGIGRTVAAGAHLQHERVALQNAGRSEADMAAIQRRAIEVTKSVPTSTMEENLKVINETTGAFGSVEHAMENLEFMAKATSVLHAAAGDKIKQNAGEMGNSFARFFEMRGTALNSERFRHEGAEMVRAMAFFRGNFNPHEMLNFAQQATPGTISNYDEHFLTRIMPSLVTEFHGERAGTAANAFRNTILGKARDKKQAMAWVKAGLLDKKDADLDSKGAVIGWQAGAIRNTDLALRDPLKWAETELLPRLSGNGINIDNSLELTKTLGLMFRNSMANRFAEAISQSYSRQRLHKDEVNINAGGDLDTIYQRNLKTDPTVAITALSAAVSNLAAAASSPAMATAASYISGIAGALQSLSAAATEHPNIALGVAGGAATAAMGGAGWLTYQLYSGFGLSSSAAQLSGAAAELSAAAAALKGGSAPGVAPAGSPGGGIPFWASVLSGGTLAYQTWRTMDDAKHTLGNLPVVGWGEWWHSKMRDIGLEGPGGGRIGGPSGETTMKAEGRVVGEVTVNLKLDASGFIRQMVRAPLSGVFGGNGPGSVGHSSPDAAAPPVGGL